MNHKTIWYENETIHALKDFFAEFFFVFVCWCPTNIVFALIMGCLGYSRFGYFVAGSFFVFLFSFMYSFSDFVDNL